MQVRVPEASDISGTQICGSSNFKAALNPRNFNALKQHHAALIPLRGLVALQLHTSDSDGREGTFL